LRDVSAIYPYADTSVILHRTGKQVHDWLEQAVSGYRQIRPEQSGQPLLDPDFAAYVFDAFYGLTYCIDLTQPPRHDAAGRIIHPDARRITDLSHNGRPIRPDDGFAVVVNSYRAFGGGGFAAVPMAEVLLLSRQPVRTILTAYLQARKRINDDPAPVWHFAPITGASAFFLSAPQGAGHLTAQVSHDGPDAAGFDRYRVTF
jgi:2',3'-cyclic-nucleotide 2'-phosphodiesterase / 3'-nucleotidase